MVFYILCFLAIASSISGSRNPAFIYESLDPLSIAENFTFYELYPESPEGKLALARGWKLLMGEEKITSSFLPLPQINLQAIVSLTTKQPFDTPLHLSKEELECMQKARSNLSHHQLQGANVWSEEELLSLQENEIDLSRALLIYQFKDDPLAKEKILQYEAMLDFMALQIKARGKGQPPLFLVEQINNYIFQEMGFRFPPFSLHRKDIDLYTFLPSVLDSRHGVCLGVSILYLSLAQRLGIELEVITPPGHIYVRYVTKEETLNIETTARGIHIPSEQYLGVNTRKLEKRSLKEVIGMAFMNHAALFFQQGQYQKAINLYEKASLYIKNDRLLQMFLGINYVLAGEEAKGRKILKPLCPLFFDYAVSEETIPADYLHGFIDAKGLAAIFTPVDDSKESILAKQKKLEQVLQKYPKFREGLLQLAVAHLQLNNTKEAIKSLKTYISIDPNDITVSYYLAVLSFETLDYNAAWKYLNKAKTLGQARDYLPKALQELYLALRKVCPPPSP